MRTRDRLEELRQRAGAGAVYRGTTEPAPPPAPDDDDDDMDAALQEVERLRGWTRDLARNTQLLRRLHADPTYHTNRQIQEQLDAVVTQSNAVGLKACGALRQLEARAAQQRGSGVRARIVRLQARATRRLLADALSAHHTALAAVRDARLDLLRAQLRLTDLALTDEECHSLLDADDVALFVGNVRAETTEARRALRDVEARHEELLRVEGSLREVRELFAQLAHLVALQQDQVDSVEHYALQAGERVESGGRQLLQGSVSRGRAWKKKVSLIICLASGFLVVLMVLVLT